LQVPAGVILRGEEADKGATMAIIGSGIFISRTFARQNVTILAGNNSEIRGVTVTNPSTRGTGIWIESTNPRIQNCTFTNNNREGIFITGTGNPKIVQNVFSLNGGNGISTANSAQGDIEDNVFQNTGFGLAIGGNSTPKISKNRIIENTDGLYINDNARPILRNNIIENNKRDGVVATIAAKPDLGTAESNGGNVIRNNRQFDLNNSTNGTLYSVGNTLSTQKIAGRVEFVAGEGQSTFADVQGNWAAAYIEALAKRNIITGFPDGSFRPDDPVTRAQYAAIINKAFAPAPKQAAIEFSDVNPSFWGYQPIQTAVTGGFLRGYPEGVFRPNQRIPKVQVLVALSTGLSFPAPTDFSTLSLFQDAGAIPDYARSAIATATQRRIVVNYPSVGLLQPNREATRAEVAALVYQALVTSGKAQAIASPYIVSP
jgi:parallel beta-helix repeat protein